MLLVEAALVRSYVSNRTAIPFRTPIFTPTRTERGA
jgi:hypothetical protein